MELALIIYLIGVADGIGQLCSIYLASYTGIMGILLLFSPMIFDAMQCAEESTKVFTKSIISKAFKVAIFAVICILFIPSAGTSHKMLVAYGAQAVAENPDVQEIMGESIDVLKLTLKEYKDTLNK